MLTRLRKRLSSVVCAVPLCACSLLNLDDFDLKPCNVALDCYGLSQHHPNGASDCYRCVNRVCEHATMKETHRISDADIASLTTTSSKEAGTLVLAVSRGRQPKAWALPAEGTTPIEQTPFMTADPTSQCFITPSSTGGCQYRELVMSWLSPHNLVAVGINTTGCASGQVEVRLVTDQQPLALETDVVSDALKPGIDLMQTQTGYCTVSDGIVGARSPAVAAATETDALAVWLATSIEQLPGTCPGASSPLVPVTASPRLRVQQSVRRAELLTAVEPATTQRLLHAAVAVEPRLIALGPKDAAAYLLATADTSGVHVSRIEASGALDAVPAFDSDDPAVSEIALAATESEARSHDVLVAWRTGCGAASEIRFALLRESGSELVELQAPMVVQRGSIGAGPVAAYSAAAFGRASPPDGWTLVWREMTPLGPGLSVARIARTGRVVGRPQDLRPGAADHFFVHHAETAPFSYGLVSETDDEHRDLVFFGCE